MGVQPHELYQVVMPRGAAGKVGAEMGYADGSVPRSWRRPAAGPNNLFTGERSHIMRAGDELLAHDRIGNHDAADILLFKLFSDLARQRARLHPTNEREILLKLAAAFHQAMKAFTIDMSPEAREVALYRAGSAIVDGLCFVLGDDGAAATPLKMVEQRPGLFRRVLVSIARAL